MTRHRSLIVGNWKMNNGVAESLKLLTGLEHHIKGLYDAEIVIAPPFTSLYSVSVALQSAPFLLAAQNVGWEERGAFTGEISPLFLSEIGCTYVIVGHSERRHLFGETDEMINKKLDSAIRNELIPIFCVGETLEEREAGETESVIERQIKRGLSRFHIRDAESMVMAYEPVWAIGTGKTASPGQAAEVHQFIRNLIAKLFDAPTAQNLRILYGGSVKGDNAPSLLSLKDIDGLLVGGASLDAEEFAKIVRASGIGGVKEKSLN